MKKTRHLDLGCGLTPRNPYLCSELFGCDVRAISDEVSKLGFTYAQVNLVTQKIPFPDNYFDSVSAFDFFEHVPRQIVLPSGVGRNSFVELMSEIHRVLTPGGKLLAVTPCYPHPEAFRDPTHVNIITAETHEYFTGAQPAAAMYGFTGRFEVIKVGWDSPVNVIDGIASPLRKWLRRTHRKLFRGGLSHQLWELKKY